MRNNLCFLLLAIGIYACGGGKATTSSTFKTDTAHHQRIAVLPFQSKIKLRKKQLESITQDELKELEIAQGKEVQNAVESYLLDKNLRVRVQSQRVTNSKLKSNGIDLSTILDQDITKLASLLGVDAVVAGEIETDQPMSDELARGLNIAKKLAWDLGSTLGGLGAAVNTTTNQGWCNISIFEGQYGDRLWTYRNDISMGQGSTIQDVINKMMKKGAKKFPY